jgi:hypothetical protein
MGAMAISAFAGAQLVQNAPDAPFLAAVLPFLKGFTVFYWATGTWAFRPLADERGICPLVKTASSQAGAK